MNQRPVETGSESVNRLNFRSDHHCFGCGKLNPQGLQLDFFVTDDGEGLWSPFTPVREHEGFMGVVHGGIITSVLDEVMGWVVIHRGIWAVTGKIAVSFRKPVEVGVATRATGWVTADRGRLVDVGAELIREADNLPLANATATFVRVPEDQAREWEARYLDSSEAVSRAPN